MAVQPAIQPAFFPGNRLAYGCLFILSCRIPPQSKAGESHIKDHKKDQTIAAITFPNDTVTCHDMFQQLFFKEMNEKIYHMVKFDSGQSMSKTQFHNIYKDIEILELRKDGKKIDLSTLAESTDALNDWEEGANKVGKDGGELINNNKELVFGFLQDAEDNTSFNLVWL